jgi:hypothetical protein
MIESGAFGVSHSGRQGVPLAGRLQPDSVQAEASGPGLHRYREMRPGIWLLEPG